MHPSNRSASPENAVVCAIPARYAATRLPGKPLLELAGRPLIQHVYERAASARGLSRVVVLTDDERIAAAVRRFGGEVELTPSECPSGTDRIAWAARAWPETAVLNVQGDEPLLEPDLVTRLAERLLTGADEMVTLAAPADPGDAADPAKVKVVRDLEGRALYFSRAAIPHGASPGELLRHVGIYGYQRATLLRLAAWPPTPLELRERLEQLRALEHGVAIRVLLCEHAGFGVDTPEDLERAAHLLERTTPRAEGGGRP